MSDVRPCVGLPHKFWYQTGFSATIYQRLLKFCMQSPVVVPYSGVRFQVCRTSTFFSRREGWFWNLFCLLVSILVYQAYCAHHCIRIFYVFYRLTKGQNFHLDPFLLRLGKNLIDKENG